MKVTIDVWKVGESYQATWPYISHSSIVESVDFGRVLDHVKGVAMIVLGNWEQPPSSVEFDFEWRSAKCL